MGAGPCVSFSFFHCTSRMRSWGSPSCPPLRRDVRPLPAPLRWLSSRIDSFSSSFFPSCVAYGTLASPEEEDDEGNGGRGGCGGGSASCGNGGTRRVAQARGRGGGVTKRRAGGGNVEDAEGGAMYIDTEDNGDGEGKGLPERGGGAMTREGNREASCTPLGTPEGGGTRHSFPPPYHCDRFFNRKTNERDGADGGEAEIWDGRWEEARKRGVSVSLAAALGVSSSIWRRRMRIFFSPFASPRGVFTRGSSFALSDTHSSCASSRSARLWPIRMRIRGFECGEMERSFI